MMEEKSTGKQHSQQRLYGFDEKHGAKSLQ